MAQRVFEASVLALGLAFTIFFFAIVFPPLLASGDVVGAFAAGFVNPFASGYSTDVIMCALILIVWMIYERQQFGIRHGWVILPLSFFPGVALAFAVYLVLRSRQISKPQS